MRCVRTPIEADVVKYEVGQEIEDGFELLSEVVTKEWVVTDSLIKVIREDGSIVCPYILERRGRKFINEGDYIIIEDDGVRHVCGEDIVFKRYQKI